MIYSVFKFNSKRSCYEGLKYLTCVQCQDLTRIESGFTERALRMTKEQQIEEALIAKLKDLK